MFLSDLDDGLISLRCLISSYACSWNKQENVHSLSRNDLFLESVGNLLVASDPGVFLW